TAGGQRGLGGVFGGKTGGDHRQSRGARVGPPKIQAGGERVGRAQAGDVEGGRGVARGGGAVKDVASRGFGNDETAATVRAAGGSPVQAGFSNCAIAEAHEILGVGGGVGVEVDVEAGDLRVGAGGEHGDGGQGEETLECGFHGRLGLLGPKALV